MSGVPITGKFVPSGIGGFPLVDQQDLLGGWRSVPDLTARDAIPPLSRAVGMQVNVISNGIIYQLGAGLTNGEWTPTGRVDGPNPNSVISGDSEVYIEGGDAAFNSPLSVVALDGWVFIGNSGEQTFTEINPIPNRASRVIQWLNGGDDYDPITGMAPFNDSLVITNQGSRVWFTDIQVGGISAQSSSLDGQPGPAIAISPITGAHPDLAWVVFPNNGGGTLWDSVDIPAMTTVTSGPIIGVGPNPGAMDVTFDALNDKVWASNQAGATLYKIDPATAGLDIPAITDVLLTWPTSILAATGYLWVADGIGAAAPGLLRVNLTTGAIVDKLVDGALGDPESITYDNINNKIWAIDVATNTLVRVDPTSNTVEHTIVLLTGSPGDFYKVTYALGFLWVTQTSLPGVIRVDPVTDDQQYLVTTGPGFVFNRENHSRVGDTAMITNDDGVVLFSSRRNVPLPDFPRFDGQQHTCMDISGNVVSGYETQITSSQGILGQYTISGNYTALTFKWSKTLGMWLST